MTTYLIIITTILVLTQVIRLLQNFKQLKSYEETQKDQQEIKLMWQDMVESMDALRCEIKHIHNYTYDRGTNNDL